MDIVPIHEKIRKDIQERISVLKQSIKDFNTPITQKDHDDHFKQRLTGSKSTEALEGYYTELLKREDELHLIIEYDHYFKKNNGG